MKGIVREVVSTLLLALVFYLVLHLSIQTFQVIGYSMRPSLQDGQRLVANKIIYLFRDPRRGEIVILKRPYGPDYVKRVVAVPDDTVEIRQGMLLLNGVAVEEPYILETPRYSLAPQVIGPGHYFVLGDNRNNSNDSHLFGPIAKKDIVGFAWISIWPPKKWGLAPNYSLAPPGESSALNRAATHLSLTRGQSIKKLALWVPPVIASAAKQSEYAAADGLLRRPDESGLLATTDEVPGESTDYGLSWLLDKTRKGLTWPQG